MAFMKFYVGNEANASSHRDGIYIAVDTKKIFYNGSAYGGSEVDLSNYYTIAQVNSKIGTNVYTGANYISKETNLTDAVLQLDEEIKATNDNLDLEHTNAEATYAKKTDLNNYLTRTDASNTYQPKGNYLTSVSIATISDLNANWDALLKSDPSVHVTRWPNISEVGSRQDLIIKLNGGTTEGTNQFTYNVTARKSINITPSSIGAAASSHTHTASQVSGLSKVATSGSYNDLTNKPSIPSAYTLPKATTSTLGGIKVGDGLEITGDGTLNCIIDPGSGTVSWGNIQGKPSVFATNIASINDLNSGWDALLKAAPNIPSLNGYATQAWVNGRGFLTSVPSEYVTDTELNAKGFLTKTTAEATYAKKTELSNQIEVVQSVNTKIVNAKLSMASWTSGADATKLTFTGSSVGLIGTPAIFFAPGGITGGTTIPTRSCIRFEGCNIYQDSNGFYVSLPIVEAITTSEIDNLFK